VRTISAQTARRLAITRQRLAGPRSKPNAEGILDVVRDLGCLQLDPISVVAPSHQLVVFSRVGPYQKKHLDTLLWEERRLFEAWAHAASIVLTEHYPIHGWITRRYAAGKWSGSPRALAWVKTNDPLRRRILGQLRTQGPLPSRAFEAPSGVGWRTSGWNNDRNVGMMLAFLWRTGRLMVAGRQGGQKLWDFAERCLPAWAPKTRLSEPAIVRWAAEISLRALGVGRARDIGLHFIAGKYPNLPAALISLEKQGRITPLNLKDAAEAWPATWYVHADDMPLLDQIEAGEWSPRTTLLSPFDNLIRDRARTQLMFGLDFKMEIYVPALERQFGYYVMPVLHEDRLVARVDPSFDRASKRLSIRGISVEPGCDDTGLARSTRDAIAELGTFVGAGAIDYDGRVPSGWRRTLSA
jgi:uncharacterized protein YcaQ